MNTPTLTTPNLVLRRLEASDAPTLHNIYQMDGVLTFFPSAAPPPLEKVARFIAGQEKHWLEYRCGNWGIQPHGETEIIGWAGLQFLPELDETEVGYLLSPPQWGKGYATEAARESLRFGFEHLNLNRIIALVHPENLASRRVLAKCGMVYEETIHLWGIDLMRHSVTREQYHDEPYSKTTSTSSS